MRKFVVCAINSYSGLKAVFFHADHVALQARWHIAAVRRGQFIFDLKAGKLETLPQGRSDYSTDHFYVSTLAGN